jgi:ATP-dependent Clp protease protease subunit
MIHQPWGGAQGQASDIAIQAKEILKTKESLNKIIAKHAGQPLDRIEKDSDRNFWMSPPEAKEYGLIDEVYEKKLPAVKSA